MNGADKIRVVRAAIIGALVSLVIIYLLVARK